MRKKKMKKLSLIHSNCHKYRKGRRWGRIRWFFIHNCIFRYCPIPPTLQMSLLLRKLFHHFSCPAQLPILKCYTVPIHLELFLCLSSVFFICTCASMIHLSEPQSFWLYDGDYWCQSCWTHWLSLNVLPNFLSLIDFCIYFVLVFTNFLWLIS